MVVDWTTPIEKQLEEHMNNQKQKKKWWIWVIIVVVVAAALANTFGDKDNKDKETKKADNKAEKTEAAEEKKTEKETEAESEAESEATQEEKDYFTIGETAEQKGVLITLQYVVEDTGSEFNKPDDGKVFVLPVFEIENKSEKEIHISSIMSVDAYVDGYSTNFSISSMIESEEKTLDGTVASNKKLKGAYGMEVPEDWQEIEIRIEPIWGSDAIVFKFTNDK